jgi:hypothetical protein
MSQQSCFYRSLLVDRKLVLFLDTFLLCANDDTIWNATTCSLVQTTRVSASHAAYMFRVETEAASGSETSVSIYLNMGYTIAEDDISYIVLAVRASNRASITSLQLPVITAAHARLLSTGKK